jgi:hypothetical protein
MATRARQAVPLVERDRAFFFAMAMAIVVTMLSGFALQFAAGRSSLASPWWVHVHGMTAVGWLALYATQNFLVFRGSFAAHQRLGMFASVYLAWMVVAGLSITLLAAVAHRIPPFFEPNVFLVMDSLNTVVFAGFTWAGVALRAQPDWHRRLMLCGAVQVMPPGIGRLLPLPLMGTWILWSIWLAMMLYLSVAVAYDLLTRGKVHPAYLWGVGVITVTVAVMRPIAFSAPVLALTQTLTG